MKRYKLAIISILTLCACNNIDRQNKAVGVVSNDIFMQETNDGTKTTKRILDNFLPSVLAFAKADTSTFYYGDNVIDEDSIFRQLIIGKFIDKTTIIAVEINIKDTIINFYYVYNNTWKLIGSERTNIPIYRIEFEDLNGDNKNEIVLSTSRNMNGNTWQEVYCFSDKTNTIRYAGSFPSNYEVKKDKKQIEVYYTGSFYMDNIKTLYEWRHDKLIPVRQIVITQENIEKEKSKLTFKYYENLTEDIKGLKLKYEAPFNGNKKLAESWDNFFSENK